MSDVPVFDTFEQFWPYYVKEHAKPLTRLLHFIGTTIAVPMGLVAFRHPRRAAYLIPAALVREHSTFVPHTNSHKFHLRESNCVLPEVVDVTARLSDDGLTSADTGTA